MDDAGNDGLREDFLVDAGDLLQRLGAQLVGLESAPDQRGRLDAVFRTFHSIKGGAGFLGLEAVAALCHCAEELLKDARERAVDLAPAQLDALLEAVDVLAAMFDAAAARAPVAPAPAPLLRRLLPAGAVERPPAAAGGPPQAMGDDEFEDLLDSLHGRRAPGNPGARPPWTGPASGPGTGWPAPGHADGTAMVHVASARLDSLAGCVDAVSTVRRRVDDLARRDGALAAVAGELDRAHEDLALAVSDLRMQPIGQLFQRFPRVVRELARKLGKDAELVLEGAAIDLDRGVIEALADALVHLLRNALDHGIGTPEERRRAGKPPRGRVTLAAGVRGDGVVITVRDDGRGMDPEALRRHAVDKGLLDAAGAARLGTGDCFDLVFRPGFSTAATASEISGRGFGMDVVKTRLQELGGRVQLRSTPGQGTEVELCIPLARSALSVLVVTASARAFALPAANVEEVFELSASREQVSDGSRAVRHRGRVLPLASLSGWPFTGHAGGHWVVVLRDGQRYAGCLVDAIGEREDVMFRPLGPMFAGLPGIAGVAVLADGASALVVDAATLVGHEDAASPRRQMEA